MVQVVSDPLLSIGIDKIWIRCQTMHDHGTNHDSSCHRGTWVWQRLLHVASVSYLCSSIKTFGMPRQCHLQQPQKYLQSLSSPRTNLFSGLPCVCVGMGLFYQFQWFVELATIYGRDNLICFELIMYGNCSNLYLFAATRVRKMSTTGTVLICVAGDTFLRFGKIWVVVVIRQQRCFVVKDVCCERIHSPS